MDPGALALGLFCASPLICNNTAASTRHKSPTLNVNGQTADLVSEPRSYATSSEGRLGFTTALPLLEAAYEKGSEGVTEEAVAIWLS
jgi:hypothetical protein